MQGLETVLSCAPTAVVHLIAPQVFQLSGSAIKKVSVHFYGASEADRHRGDSVPGRIGYPLTFFCQPSNQTAGLGFLGPPRLIGRFRIKRFRS